METFEEDLCGIPVITTIDIIENTHVRLAKNGFPLFKTTGPGTFTSTNPANGKSVVETFSGTTKDLTVVDNGDGTITVRTAITGVAQEVTLSDGTVAIKDVGRIVVATVLDYNRTPTDTSDDEFISQTIESISGPHPNLESNFTPFCEVVVVPALTSPPEAETRRGARSALEPHTIRNRWSSAGMSGTPETGFVVLGRLQQRSWTVEDGSARSTVEVVADAARLVGWLNG